MTQRENLQLCANSLLVVIDGIACVLSMLWQKQIGGQYISGKIDVLLDIRMIVKEIQEEINAES